MVRLSADRLHRARRHRVRRAVRAHRPAVGPGRGRGRTGDAPRGVIVFCNRRWGSAFVRSPKFLARRKAPGNLSLPKRANFPKILGHMRTDVDHLPAAKQRELERSEEHTSELQSLMRISYAVSCLKIKK